MFSATPNLCLGRECESVGDVSISLMQTEDLRSSVVALDGSDGRTQQLDAPMQGGRAELATGGDRRCHFRVSIGSASA